MRTLPWKMAVYMAAAVPLMMYLVMTNFVLYFPLWCLGWDLGLNSVSS